MRRNLLRTKLHIPPSQRTLVSRVRLLERLESGLQPGARLVLVSAQAGAGKSTLLAEWAGRTALPVAWLALDADDDEPYRFWTYCLAALDAQYPGRADQLLDELQSPQPPPLASFQLDLLNWLADLPGPALLILDDYHVIHDTAVHESLTYVLERLPENCHIAIATRTDPPLPLARWRARGQLAELRVGDLRFTPAEAATFLNERMGLQLSEDGVRQLENRTEGWAVGLHLAALSAQGRDDAGAFIARFTGSHHYVLEYLTGEVLAQQPPAVQEFLLQTSILTRFCAPLCDAVMGDAAGADRLAALRHDNLFVIPLDDERYWHRYHHLFAELLRERLGRRGQETVKALHRRAAEWYGANGLVDEALAHAQSGEHMAYAAQLVNGCWRQAVHDGRIKDALRWIESIPPALRENDTLLSTAYSLVLYILGRASDMPPQVAHARRAFNDLAARGAVPQDDFEYTTLPGQLGALEAILTMYRGDLPGSIRAAHEALALSGPQDYLPRGLAYTVLSISYRELGTFDEAVEAHRQAVANNTASGNTIAASLGAFQLGRLLYQLLGRLDAAEKVYVDVLRDAEARGLGQLPAYGIQHVGLAILRYERNDLDGAEALLAKGVDQGIRGGYIDLIKSAGTLRAQLRRARGDNAGALHELEDVAEASHRAGAPTIRAEVGAMLARAQAENGQPERARAWLAEVDAALTFDRNPGLTRGIQAFAAARARLALGEPDHALHLMRAVEHYARESNLRGRLMEALLLEAVAHAQRQDFATALPAFEESLSLAEEQGYVRTFVDEGRPVQWLLERFLARPGRRSPRLDDYARKLQAALAPAAAPATARPAALVEPLSTREIEVLQCIAGGLSNPEIAGQLCVSVSTVKTHINNIFGKLGVQNRVQALKRARELGVLTDTQR